MSKHQLKIRRLAEFQDNLCFYCNRDLEFFDLNETYCETKANGNYLASLDHFLPRSKGGTGNLVNLVVAHRICNSSIGSRERSDEETERLIVLNNKRKFGHEPLTPNTFTTPSDATDVLFARLNAVEDALERHRLHKVIGQRIQKHIMYVKDTVSLPPAFRHRILGLLAAEDRINRNSLGDPWESLLDNVLSTLNKKVKREALVPDGS